MASTISRKRPRVTAQRREPRVGDLPLASAITHKRPRAAIKARKVNDKPIAKRYLVNEQGRRVAIVLDLAEYRRLVESSRAFKSRDAGLDWLAEARRVRALAQPSADSTPILRDLREGRLR